MFAELTRDARLLRTSPMKHSDAPRGSQPTKAARFSVCDAPSQIAQSR
jgi:hypothetical protein